MKTKLRSILVLLFAFTMQFVFAQKAVKGNVTDDAGPLSGVNVVIKGTKTGTVTDFDGNYTIQAKQGDVLQFSFVGMETQNKTVGAGNVIDVKMSMDKGNVITEVVVTAQNIKREKKSLGYAVSTVNPEELQQKPEGDVSRVLQGKVAGVNITPTGGLAGSGNTVIVRSKLSLTGDNQPLYVVDGVPFYSNANSTDNVTGEYFTGMSGSNTSNRSLDIDPNNIASISVLKGLSATVLYGNEGRNGVILITTKSGSAGNFDKKLEISVSQTTSLSQISNLPEYQNRYGQGAALRYSNSFIGNWGPAFDSSVMVAHNYDQSFITSVFPEYSGLKVPYVAVPNNVKDFFKDGLGYTTSVNVSKGFENSSFNFSYGRVNEEGYVPNNSLQRNSYSAGGTAKLSNKINVGTALNFVNTVFKTPPIAAGNSWFGSQSSIFSRLLYIPRNFDLMNLPYQNPITGESIFYRDDIDNPRWLLENASTEQNTNRFFGKINFDYNLTDWFNLSYRLGLDQINENETNFTNKGGKSYGYTDIGYLRETNGLSKTMDHSIIATFKNIKILEDLGFNFITGFNYKRYDYHLKGLAATEQVLFGFKHTDNFREKSSIEYIQNMYDKGVYGQAEFDYKKYLYMTLAARNDWTSTLETGNNSLFYPSVSLSFVPTDAFSGLKSETLNFLKFRGGYATSAGFPPPYYTRSGTNLDANANGGSTTVVTQSYSNRMPNPNLKPELHSEYEIGLETKMFKNKLDIDLSLYQRVSKDQILDQSLDPATGYTYRKINAGRVDTEGIELGVKYKIFNRENFKWLLTTNFNAYESTVVKLVDGQDKVSIDGFSNLGNFAIEGEPLGVIMGDYAVKDEQGNFLIDYTNGTVINSSDLSWPIKIIGDPNPDFTLNFINSVSFSNFTLGAQIDYTHGGDIYSLTASHLMRRGVTEYNADNREGFVVLDGLLADPKTGELITDANGNAIQNNIPITLNNMYFINVVDNDEENVYDGTVIRLREVSLSYDLPTKLLDKTPFGSLSFSLVGQNIWFNAVNIPKAFNFDPEVISTGSGNGQGLEFQSAPSAKKFGFSVKLTF